MVGRVLPAGAAREAEWVVAGVYKAGEPADPALVAAWDATLAGREFAAERPEIKRALVSVLRHSQLGGSRSTGDLLRLLGAVREAYAAGVGATRGSMEQCARGGARAGPVPVLARGRGANSGHRQCQLGRCRAARGEPPICSASRVVIIGSRCRADLADLRWL
jgi:hypothetical protein